MSTVTSRDHAIRERRLYVTRFRFWYLLPLALAFIAAVWLIIQLDAYSLAVATVDRYSPVIVLMGWGERLLGSIGYPGLVAIIFVENVFPPIPSDIILPLAGYTAATTPMTLLGAVLATTGGSLLGALALYGVGAWLGEERVRGLAKRYGRYLTFEEDELDRSLGWFRRHGSVVVMVARVVPVFRSLISIPAGMSRMPIGRFLIFTAIGAGAWNSGLISAGYLLGTNWELVVSWLDSYQVVMLSANAGIFLVFATMRVRAYRRRQSREGTEPSPTG